MRIKEVMLWVVLLWGHISPVETSCELTEDENGCVCSTDVLGSREDLKMCFRVQELELRNGHLFDQSITVSLEDLRYATLIRKLVFRNVSISPEFLYEMIKVLPLTKVNTISISESTIEGLTTISNQNYLSRVKTLRLDGVTISPSLLQPSYRPLHSWLLEPLTSFSLKNSHLSSQQVLCDLLTLASHLQDLDLSWSNFSDSRPTNPVQCFQEGKGPRKLDLSHSALTDSEHTLPTTLTVLDLSANALEQFPSLENQTKLEDLRVDGNRLRSLLNGTGATLGVLGQLKSLYAGRNPYHCDCSLKETLDFLRNTRSGVVKDWPQEFVCHTPLSLRGTLLTNFPLPGTCNDSDIMPGMNNASPLSVGKHFGSLSLLIWLIPILL